MSLRDLPLPESQFDLALVLASRTVLWKQAGPMFPMSGELHTTDFHDTPDLHAAPRANAGHRRCDFFNDSGVPKVLEDSELEDASGHVCDVSVAEMIGPDGTPWAAYVDGCTGNC